MSRTPVRAVVFACAVALSAAACGSDSGPSSRDVFGSDEGPGDVDVTGLGDESFTIETDDGSISVGGAQGLPGRLELPVLDGGDIISVFEADDQVAVVLSYAESDFDAVAAFYDAQMEGRDGFSRSSFNIDSADGEQIRNVSWLRDGGSESVNITTCPDLTGGDGRLTCVTLAHP